MKHQPQERKGHPGFALASLAAAAGLVAAAFVYLRRRGVNPTTELKKLGNTARSLGAILHGESAAAYKEVRQAVVEQLVAKGAPVNRTTVYAAINEVLRTLRKHAGVTATQLKPLADQLKAEWEYVRRTAAQQKKSKEDSSQKT